MDAQRITISLPSYLANQIKQKSNGNVSKYIQDIVKRDLALPTTDLYKTKKQAIEDFLLLREEAPKYTTKEINKAIKKGRKFDPEG